MSQPKQCRTFGCGCEAGDTNYCSMCAEYTPVCPACGSVYGEHYLDCDVADGYTDCQEGPWETRDAAETFAHAEVGLPWQVVSGGNGWFVMVKHTDD